MTNAIVGDNDPTEFYQDPEDKTRFFIDKTDDMVGIQVLDPEDGKISEVWLRRETLTEAYQALQLA